MNLPGAAPLLLAGVLVLAASEGPIDSGESARHLPARPISYIQDLIEASPAGAVIRVPAAVYLGRLVVDREVTLLGDPGTVIDGEGDGSVVTILSDGVTLGGFEIRGSGPGPIDSPSGVLVEGADRVRLEELTIGDSYLGITAREAGDLAIARVSIRGRKAATIDEEMHAVSPDDQLDPDSEIGVGLRGDGIWLWNVTGAVVADSQIDSVRDGIYLTYGERLTIENNLISDSRYGIHDMYAATLAIRGNRLEANLSAVVLMYGGPVLVEGNTLLDNGSPSTGFGVLVKDAGDVEVAGNTIVDNRVGVHLDDAGRTGAGPTRMEGNLVGANQIGVLIYPSADSVITGNTFTNNVTQVVLAGSGATQALWSEDGRGNHWSTYTGFDADRDGIGDLPYVESGRIGQVIARSPVLIALASGPAFRLLAAVGDRWASTNPVVIDEAPVMGPALVAPMESPYRLGPLAPLGGGLLIAGAVGVAAGRRYRRGAAHV